MVKNFLFYFTLEVLLFVGCALVDEPDCGLSNGSKATVASIEAQNIDLDSYNNLALLLDDDTVGYGSHYIWLQTEAEFISQKGSLINKTVACSVQTPELVDEITDIQIFSLVDYNDSIRSGMRLDAYFSFITPDNKMLPIHNFDELNRYFKSEYYLFLKNDIPPADNRQIQYSFKVRLKERSELNFETAKVFVLK